MCLSPTAALLNLIGSRVRFKTKMAATGEDCPSQGRLKLCVWPPVGVLVKNNSGVTPAGQCGDWVKELSGGSFTSPNYPEKYPADRECIYIIEGEAAHWGTGFFELCECFTWMRTITFYWLFLKLFDPRSNAHCVELPVSLFLHACNTHTHTHT